MNSFTIDQEKCNRDGICAAECPALIIRWETKEDFPTPLPDFDEICLKCGHCVAVCPTGAFSFDWLKPEECAPISQELKVTGDQAEQLLCGRRSIRTFKEKKVPRNILEKLIEIACAAPSAKNKQPWNWTVIEDPADVKRYAGMVIDWMRTMIQDFPEEAQERGFVRAVATWDEGFDRICRGAPHILIAHGDKEWGFGPEDCALALGHLDLYATSIGLGACWGGFLYNATNLHPPLFEALGLPSEHKAFGAIMVGYPKFKYPRIPIRNQPKVTWK